jgi:hypothetical protein
MFAPSGKTLRAEDARHCGLWPVNFPKVKMKVWHKAGRLRLHLELCAFLQRKPSSRAFVIWPIFFTDFILRLISLLFAIRLIEIQNCFL